jgi:hypothetical protein
MKFLRKILTTVTSVYATLRPFIDLLGQIDITRLNDDDRYAIGVCAAEIRQTAAAMNQLADAFDAAKDDGISPAEYEEILRAAHLVLDEAADIGPAVKGLF